MPKRRISKKQLILAVVFAVGIVVLGCVFWQPIQSIVEHPDRIKTVVQSTGIFGPLVFIAIQFLQIIIAPIPGQIIGFASGALFGPWLGTLYSVIGSLLGIIVVISIARKLGRPFVEKVVSPTILKKFDYLINGTGPIVFFCIMLLPIFPDDLICYLIGLSRIPVRTLVIVGVLGRVPATLVSAFIGAGIADINIPLVIGLSFTVATVGALGYWKRATLESWMRSLAGKHRKSKNSPK